MCILTSDAHVSGAKASFLYLFTCLGSFVCEGVHELCNPKMNSEHKSAHARVLRYYIHTRWQILESFQDKSDCKKIITTTHF